MPIIIACPQCKGQLRVADDLIGCRVRCPACSHTFEAQTVNESPRDLPLKPQIETERVDPWKHLNLELTDDPPATSDPSRSQPPDLSGAVEIGSSSEPPSSPPEQSQRRPRLSDDHDDLRSCPTCRRMVHTDARYCSYCDTRLGRLAEDEEDDDHLDVRRGRRRSRRDWEPHRGGLVLTMGILSLALPVTCWCFWFVTMPAGLIFGLIAWIVGHMDLRRIKQGFMDPDGEGSTQAGWICGILGTCLSGLILITCGSIYGYALYAADQRQHRFNPIPFQAPPMQKP